MLAAILAPGIAASTVPPSPNLGDLLDWTTAPKIAPPKDYVQYSQCQVQDKSGQQTVAAYCDPPEQPDNSAPPSYWTAYWTREIVWESKTYRYEVTLQFSSYPDRPAQTRIFAQKPRVEFSGPTSDSVISSMSLYNGSSTAWEDCCVNHLQRAPYTKDDLGKPAFVEASDGLLSGTFWLTWNADEVYEVPVTTFALPIEAKTVNRFSDTDGTCYTWDWTPYRCTGYFTIAPA